MMRILFHNHRNHRLRSLSIYALLTLFPLMANAQVGEYRTDLAIGVNGGYMMNRISFQPEVPQSNMGGMTGGLTIRYTCEKYFSSICAITAEVNYGQMGWKENIFDINNSPVYYQDDPDNPLFYERRINYVQVPLLARLGWGRERRGVQAFIQLGPQLGFVLSESTNTNIQPGYALVLNSLFPNWATSWWRHAIILVLAISMATASKTILASLTIARLSSRPPICSTSSRPKTTR